MDQNDEYMIETAPETHKYYEFIRKSLLILVPMSILSFVFSYISGFDFSFSYNVQFSALIFSHALDRKYAFLLCNGILAFLAKSLSFSSSSNNQNMNSVSESKEDAPPEDKEASVMIYATEEKLAISQEEKDHKEKQEEVEERESRVLIVESEEGDDDEEESGLIIDGEEEGISDDVKVSTEELNKKFEEFIRKMKSEIRIEAQLQQIIAV